jgi:hypothetical protein
MEGRTRWRGGALYVGSREIEIERRGIACSFWVGSAPTHERRPFPAHPAPRDMFVKPSTKKCTMRHIRKREV